MHTSTTKHTSFSFLLILFAFSAFAQNLKPVAAMVEKYSNSGAPFSLVEAFEPSPVSNIEAFRACQSAQFLRLDLSVSAEIGISKPRAISMSLPYQGEILDLELVRSEVFTDDFLLTTSDLPAVSQKFEHGAHYRGILADKHSSVVAVSFFPDGEVMGIIADPIFGNLVLGRLDVLGNRSNYILYSEQELDAQNPAVCHTPEKGDLQIVELDGTKEVGGCVKVFLEADYELFQNKVTVQATLNYLTGVFNQMATLYANEQITMNLSQVFVWVGADTYSTTSASTALNQFMTARTSFNGNVAHLTGLGGGNLGGIGYVDVLCFTGYNYSYSNINSSYSTVPTYSWTVEVMTHEIGHNLGSNHTHWCSWTGGALDNCYTTEGGCAAGPQPTNGGTIMSYCHLNSTGINFSNGFGQQPGDLIRQRVTNATCLAATCPTPTCNAPVALTLTNVSTTSATVSWTAVSGATGYTLRHRAVGAASWATISGAVSPVNLTGLAAGSKIEVTLRSDCSGASSDFVNGMIFNTTGTSTCAAANGLNVGGISSTSATASWGAVSGATNYLISTKLTSSSTWGTAVSTTGTNLSISGLSASTSYDLRVQTVCSGGSSTYSQVSFTTSAAATCNAPSSLTTSSITSTSASTSWTAVSGAASYSISRKLTSSSTWGTATSTTSTSYNHTGLTASTSYDVRVQTICSGGSSTYSQSTFTTSAAAAGCGAPTGVAASNVQYNAATCSWTAVSGATSYKYNFKKSSSSNWGSTYTATSPSVNLTGLSASTAYSFRVYAVCSSGNSATTSANFTTTAIPTCGAPTNVAASTVTATAATVTWTAVSGASSYKVKYKKSTSSKWSSIYTVTSPSFSLSALSQSTIYQVQVYTACSWGNSTTVQIQFTTPATLIGGGNKIAVFNNTTIVGDDQPEPEKRAVINWNPTHAAEKIEMKILPNPASEQVKINLQFEQEKMVKVEILDLLGNQAIIDHGEGERLDFQFSLNDLKEGVYFVRVSERGKMLATRRLVKN